MEMEIEIENKNKIESEEKVRKTSQPLRARNVFCPETLNKVSLCMARCIKVGQEW